MPNSSSTSTADPTSVSKTLIHTDSVHFLVDENSVIQSISGDSACWFARATNGVTVLDDQWFSGQGMQLCDRQFRTLSINMILSDQFEERYFGIATANSTKWVKWSIQHKDKIRFLVITDISDLMNDVFEFQNRAEKAVSNDITTKLYNRRYALERLEQFHLHAKRYKAPFSLAIIDIDHFKRINDTFGHTYGDAVLGRLASVIKKSFRETDLCARFGGEEFLVIMPESNSENAILSLDRLRQKISELKWKQMQRPVTISAGVIDWQQQKSVEQLIFLADQRLSTAKKAGRNQVCGNLG